MRTVWRSRPPGTERTTSRRGSSTATPPEYRKDGSVRKQGYDYYRARHLLGRDDLSFHKLRHFAATNYAVAGATTKELMVILGHSEPGVAMRYQHAAKDRLSDLAAKVSALAATSTLNHP